MEEELLVKKKKKKKKVDLGGLMGESEPSGPILRVAKIVECKQHPMVGRRCKLTLA